MLKHSRLLPEAKKIFEASEASHSATTASVSATPGSAASSSQDVSGAGWPLPPRMPQESTIMPASQCAETEQTVLLRQENAI
jgi:hypothetical protein